MISGATILKTLGGKGIPDGDLSIASNILSWEQVNDISDTLVRELDLKMLEGRIGTLDEGVIEGSEGEAENFQYVSDMIGTHINNFSERFTDLYNGAIKRAAEILTADGLKEGYYNIKNGLKNFFTNYRIVPTRRELALYSLAATLFILASCVQTGRLTQASLADNNPDFFSMEYPDEVARALKADFRDDPVKNSPEYGKYLVWKHGQLHRRVGEEVAQLPMLQDGISVREAEGLEWMFGLFSREIIPANLFEYIPNIDGPTFKFEVEWTRNDDKNEGSIYTPKGKVLTATSFGFENEDSINTNRLLEDGTLKWVSFTKDGDYDGLIVEMQNPGIKPIYFYSGWDKASFTKKNLLANHSLTFSSKEGINGVFKVKLSKDATPLSTRMYNIREIIKMGEGVYKVSPPLDTLLRGYVMDLFNEGDDPIIIYDDPVQLVKPVWDKIGNWSHKLAKKIVNWEEGVAYYQRLRFTRADYEYPRKVSWKYAEVNDPEYLDNNNGIGNCVAFAANAKDLLKGAGVPSEMKYTDTATVGHVYLEVPKQPLGIFVLDASTKKIGYKGPFPDSKAAESFVKKLSFYK